MLKTLVSGKKHPERVSRFLTVAGIAHCTKRFQEAAIGRLETLICRLWAAYCAAKWPITINSNKLELSNINIHGVDRPLLQV